MCTKYGVYIGWIRECLIVGGSFSSIFLSTSVMFGSVHFLLLFQSSKNLMHAIPSTFLLHFFYLSHLTLVIFRFHSSCWIILYSLCVPHGILLWLHLRWIFHFPSQSAFFAFNSLVDLFVCLKQKKNKWHGGEWIRRLHFMHTEWYWFMLDDCDNHI